MAFIVAVTVVAEVGDFQRLDIPRQLMAYLGAHALRAFQRRPPCAEAAITKAGSGLASKGP